MTDLAEGRVIAERIKLERRLADGGMGSVWIAEHLTLRTRVAVKFIDAALLEKSPELRERFGREAAIAAKITSPHVVRTFDFGTLPDGTPYLVMELLAGESLWDRLQRERPIAPALAVEIIRQTAKALDDAHLHGVVHRDIKPGNVFLTQSGRDVFVKVLDFGIAKSVEARSTDSSTKTGMTLGTPAYMSPEQLVSTKGVDLQADLWALAVTAYEILFGFQPFRGETGPSLVISIHSSTFDAPSSTRGPGSRLANLAALDGFFARAFARKPTERYATALDLADALAAAVEGKAWAPRDDAAQPSRTAYGSPIDVAADARKGATEIKAEAATDLAPSLSHASPDPEAAPAPPRSPSAREPGTKLSGPPLVEPASAPPRAADAPMGAPTSPGTKVPSSARPGWILPLAVGAGLAVAIGVWFATRSQSTPVAANTAANTAAIAAGSATASAAASAISAAPPPSANVGPPPELDIVEGRFKYGPNDTDVFVTASHVRVLGVAKASLVDAFGACMGASSVPCSEQQWEKACESEPTLGATDTWVAAVEGSRVVTRGGKDCNARALVAPKGGERAVVCCESGVATRAEDDAARRAGLSQYLRAMNDLDAPGLGAVYAERVTFNGTEHARGKLLGMGRSWFEAHPDQRYVFGLCTASLDGGRWTTVCPAVVHRDKKLLSVLERLGWRDGRVETVEESGVTPLL